MKRHDAIWPLLLLGGAIALFFWPIWLAGYRFPAGGGDLWGQLYPVWSFVSEWLREGILPLWNQRMMGGDPILSEGQYGLFNPLNWPLFLADPIPTALVLLRGAFSLWLAGAGTYLYLRRSPVWQLGRAAAMTAAVAYMLADPFVVHLGHPQFNDGMAWLPWVLWGVDTAARRARAIPLAALAVALLLLSGHGQSSLYGAMVVSIYALWQAAEGGWPAGLKRLARLGLVGAVGIALAAPALWPAMERLPLTDRAGVAEELRHGYEFPPAMLIDLLNPAFHGRGIAGFWPAWDRVESAYVGAVALYLAVLGLLADLGRRRTWVLIGLAVVAYLFALGYQGPLYPRLASLPLFVESWKTSRAIFVLAFVLAIGAALGVERLRRGPRAGIATWAAGLLGAGLLLWFAAPRWVGDVPAGEHQLRALEGLRLAALVAGGTAALGWAVFRGWHYGRAALLLLLLAELVTMGALVEVEPLPTTEEFHAAALDFMRADPGWFRVDVDVTARGLWPPVFMQMAGFEVPQGTGNPMELRTFTYFYWSLPRRTSPGYRVLGAKYIIVPKGAPVGGEGIWPVFVDDPYVDVHLNTLAMPRAWLVYRTHVVHDYGEALQRVQLANWRPELEAVVENGPQLSGEGSGRIEVVAYLPNRVELVVHTDRTALLVLSDTDYPGWRGLVDGQPTAIYRTDVTFRGLVVPAGSHRVEMRFWPASLQLGLGLAGMALGVMLAAWLLGRRRG